MSGELQAQATTGETLYAILLNASGQVWYTVTPAFENINAAHWTSYSLTMSEAAGTGIYIGNLPAGVTASGVYSALVYKQTGRSAPTLSTAAASKNVFRFYYDGTNYIAIGAGGLVAGFSAPPV